MTISMSSDHVLLLRLRAQRLTPQPLDAATGVTHVVKELCGIQVQDSRAAALAARVRSAGLIAADVEHARVQQRSIIRTGVRVAHCTCWQQRTSAGSCHSSVPFLGIKTTLHVIASPSEASA